jgi:hypothetical protein
MAYKLVTYYPEDEGSSIKKLMDRVVENSVSKLFNEAKLEWYATNQDKYALQIYNEDDTVQCICRKKIKKLFFIDNDETKTSLILGSCCIKKFLPETMKCKECGEQLKDICKRLTEKNFICPACTRYLVKIDNERKKKYELYTFYWHKHKYHGKQFYEIIHDEDFVNDLYVNGMPFDSKTLKYFLDYAQSFYTFLP